MTERLTTLLRDEAQDLDIPVPPATAVLATGRSLRRRRRLATGVAAAAVLAVAATGAVFTVDQFGDDDTTGAPGATGPGDLAFSVGRAVHLGGADDPVVTLDEDVHSLHYTSEGVVVRTNRNGGASDGSGPEHFTLVRFDGTTSELDVTTEDTVVSTDLDQRFLAYSDVQSDGTAQVVLHDVGTDREAARIDLPGSYERNGWSSPPVSLDGDTVYVGFNDVALEVDWRSADVRESELLGAGMPTVYDGHSAVTEDGAAQVIDVTTGDVLVDVEVEEYGWFILSPDGRFAMMLSESERDGEAFDVYDIETGNHVTIDEAMYDFGWTADGDLFRLEGDELRICDAETGDCSTEPSGVDPETVRAPGEPEQGEMSICDENGKCRPVESEEPQKLDVRVGGRLYES